MRLWGAVDHQLVGSRHEAVGLDDGSETTEGKLYGTDLGHSFTLPHCGLSPYHDNTTNRPGARFGPRALRANAYDPGTYHLDLEVEIFDHLEVVDYGDAVTSHGMWELSKKAVYISIDIDVLDPGFAPATGTQAPGGFAPIDLLRFIRQIVLETNVVAFDITEVSPPYDHADITVNNAHGLVWETLAALAYRRKNG